MRPRKGQRQWVRFVGYDAEGQAVGAVVLGPQGGERAGDAFIGGLGSDGRSAAGDLASRALEAEAWEIHAPNGAREDLAEVEIQHASPHRPVAWARILRVLEPSPYRAQPFGQPGHRCGGCLFAHLASEEQLWAKGQRLASLAARFPGASLSSPLVRPSERLVGYRNRSKYVIGPAGAPLPGRPPGKLRRDAGPRRPASQRPILGAYLPRSHQVASTLGCPVVDPAIGRAAELLEEIIARSGLSIYDERLGRGLLRYASIRSNHRGELLITLVTASDPGDAGGAEDLASDPGDAGGAEDLASDPGDAGGAEDLASLVDGLHELVPGLVGVTLDVNPTRGNVIFSGQGRILRGQGVIRDRYGPALVTLTGQGFGQVNREQAAAIYQAAAEAALAPLPSPEGRAPRRIWELYSGTGALAQVIAHEAASHPRPGSQGLEILGVERDASAVEQAKLAARDLGLAPTLRFVAADAGADAGAMLDGLQAGTAPMDGPQYHSLPDVVVLDPPRTGCSPELLGALSRAQVPRVVYVSCDPETLGRDLAVLEKGGYEVRSLSGFDMMPQTPHLEVLALAERVLRP